MLRTLAITMLVCSVAFVIALLSLPVPLAAAVFGAFGAIVCIPLLIVFALCVTARGALLRLIDGDEG